MQNSMVVFTFSVLERKHHFWANLVQKIKIVSLRWKLLPRQIWYADMQISMVVFFRFRRKILFLGKFRTKIQNCLFKMKFGAQTNLNMRNSIVICILFVLDQKTLFGQIWSQIKNCFFIVNFGSQTNSNMQNAMVMFPFSVFDQKYPCLGKFCSRNQNFQFKLKFGVKANSNMQNSIVMFNFALFDGNVLFEQIWYLRVIRICGTQWWCLFFLFLTGDACFGQIWSQNSKLFDQSKIWYLD